MGKIVCNPTGVKITCHHIMTRESGQCRERNNMETNIGRHIISPELGFGVLGVGNAAVGYDHINLMFSIGKVSDDVGSMFLHAAKHKRINSVSGKKDVQSGCKLAQMLR